MHMHMIGLNRTESDHMSDSVKYLSFADSAESDIKRIRARKVL